MMKRGMFSLLCVVLILPCHVIHAQTKKKGKEPELAISKRGKQIFEDDFSGKDLEWNVVSGEWKVEKKALVTRSKGTVEANPTITRPFLAAPNLVMECRTILPLKGNMVICSSWGNCNDADHPSARVANTGAQMYICYTTKENPRVDIALAPFIYPKSRWLNVVFEMLNGMHAMTVDNKTIRAELPFNQQVKRDAFFLQVYNPQGELFALDDVKVYEALPKDEGDKDKEKDKKKK